jgi:DinB family protein
VRLNPEEARRDFGKAAEDARDLSAGLRDSQFNWQPAPGKWSIGECLEHLNTAYGALPRFDRRIAEGRSRGISAAGPFRAGLIGGLYIRSIEPPVKRLRLPSPKLYRPKPDQRMQEVLPRFLKLQEELARRVEDAKGLDLARLRMSSPVTRRFKMSLIEWFAFLAAHQRRHLWQARRVREDLHFPAMEQEADGAP